MWKRKAIVCLIGLMTFTGQGFPAVAQEYEAEQLVLDWEKLSQLKQILDDMYKGYQVMEKGYTSIRDIAHGSFDLHKAFLDGLLAVSPEVKSYYKVAEIILEQLQLVKEYKAALSRFRTDPHFSAAEITYIGVVYAGIFDESLRTLDALLTILTDGALRASDEERIKEIDALETEMQNRLSSIRRFNNSQAMLSLQRARDQEDVDLVKKLYGITN